MPIPSRFAITWILAIVSAPALVAEPRPWKSADGVRTVRGELVRRDASTVTIRTDGGKIVTIELSKLHPDESEWLDLNFSLPKKAPHPAQVPPPTPVPAAPAHDPSAFFDNLTFRDTRATALIKLKSSQVVEMTTDETFIGRSGLNGIFKTRQKIGNLNGFLYFDWTETGILKELTLQTDTCPDTAYKTELEPSWRKMVDLLSTLHGKPVQKGPIPPLESLADGSFAPSHLWLLDGGGSALLGTARDGDKYQIVVRFTDKKVEVVEIP